MPLNGFLVQGLNDIDYCTKNFKYSGINAFHQYPLMTINSLECKNLTKEQQTIKKGDKYQILDFISNIDLFKRYVDCCYANNIPIRTIFIESDYSEEIWEDIMPDVDFLGYEYCPFPIDNQIVTDLDWCKPLFIYHSKLNKYGLFDTYKDAKDFKKTYDFMCKTNNIGDGCESAYICKVSLGKTETSVNTGNG